MHDTDESVTQVRTLEAGADKVFAAWIDAAQLQHWLAPIAEADGRVGGHVTEDRGARASRGPEESDVPCRDPAGRLDGGAGTARFPLEPPALVRGTALTT
jgi:Activator of Hsp90 ATPase homolog 1-like protein